MTGHAPDFCMLMVGANAGVVGMCKEHLGLALALSVPVFVVVTKIGDDNDEVDSADDDDDDYSENEADNNGTSGDDDVERQRWLQ